MESIEILVKELCEKVVEIRRNIERVKAITLMFVLRRKL